MAMRVLVAVKRVLDYKAMVRVKPDQSGVDLSGAKLSMNPFCEISVEEALRLREKGHASEVTAVTVGPDEDEAVLRSAIALGVNRAVHVLCDQHPEPLSTAKVLAAVAAREAVDLLLLGKQAIDGDHNQTATFASRIETLGDGRLEVTREVDAGTETLRVRLPAVVTSDLRLNEPRFVSLKGLLASKKKAIDKLTVHDLGVDLASPLRQISVETPEPRTPGVILSGVPELTEKLRGAGVL